MLLLENIVKTFKQDENDVTVAVDDFNLRLDAGEFAVVLGPDGSGKSTLLDLIAGRIIPDCGRITLDRKDITLQPEYRRAMLIGSISNRPESGVSGELTVAENLALAMERDSLRGPGNLLSRRRMDVIYDYLREFGQDWGLENNLHQVAAAVTFERRLALCLLMAAMARFWLV